MSDILMRPIIAMQIAVHRLREREDGQTTTEYAILLGFLAIAIIIALFFLRNVLRSLFSSAASSVSQRPRLNTTPDQGRGRDGRSRQQECAPARLPPRPGRCIRRSVHVVRTQDHPFGIADSAAQWEDRPRPRAVDQGRETDAHASTPSFR